MKYSNHSSCWPAKSLKISSRSSRTFDYFLLPFSTNNRTPYQKLVQPLLNSTAMDYPYVQSPGPYGYAADPYAYPPGRQSRHPPLTIHVISYSRKSGPPDTSPLTILRDLHVDKLPAPSRSFLTRFNGTDSRLAKAFFRIPQAQEMYEQALEDIDRKIAKRKRGRREAVVLVRCLAGVHRSVAMARRIGKELNRWEGLRATVTHQDLKRNWPLMQERYAREDRERYAQG